MEWPLLMRVEVLVFGGTGGALGWWGGVRLWFPGGLATLVDS